MICIFAKPPVPGRVKTRLAPVVGLEGAATLAAAFLDDTLASALAVHSRVAIATVGPAADLGVDATGLAGIWDQGGGDLGARIERILRRALSVAPWALALGADSPDLPRSYLAEACRALDDGQEAVIGPTEDGGYYLIGLRRCPVGLLADLPWSRHDTCAATVARLGEKGLSVFTAPPFVDVDEPPDLQRLAHRLTEGTHRAPATVAALRTIRYAPVR